MQIAYLNGEYIDQDELAIPAHDTGFMMGVTIAEQIRTFGGKSFQLEQHLERMIDGLSAVGWIDQVPVADFSFIIDQLVSRNRPHLDEGDDLGITVFVTPGPYPAYAPEGPVKPTIGIHTYPLPFRLWAEKYKTGQSLQVVDVQQVSSKCWPPEVKCRSRMHYYLADRQARAGGQDAAALLLDENGNVSETPIANVIAHLPGEGLVSPLPSRILRGVSLRFLHLITQERKIPFEFRDLNPSELESASEILLTSTPYCLLPVTKFNGQPVGDGQPGELYQSLIRDWSACVGLSIVKQAERFAQR